jgi:hypothetical protein
VVEADLAFQGVDLRDLYRPGSGLTPRRLLVLIRALPRPTAFSSGALLWHVLEQEATEAQKPKVEKIRERADYYKRMREAPVD